MKWYYLVFVLFLFSCSTARKIKTGAADTGSDVHTAASLELKNKAAALVAEQSDMPFKTFSGRAKVAYEDHNGQQPEATAHIRMEKDRFIWVSVTASFINLEAARVWMTPDSIIIVNKLEKTIEAYSLDHIRTIVSLPLTFRDIQNLIIGRIILPGDSIRSASSSDQFLSVLTGTEDVDNRIFFTLRDFLLARQDIEVRNQSGNYSAEVLYEDYEKSGSSYFSLSRDISVPLRNQKLRLTFRQYEFNNELSVPFNRPEGYTVK